MSTKTAKNPNPIHVDPSKRHDFVLLFDIKYGNPNGDPDAGNAPRTDPQTMTGLVTDACIKRKIRDYVMIAGKDVTPNRIYVLNRGGYLNDIHEEAHKAVGTPKEKIGKKPDLAQIEAARQWLCKEFYDIRMFGAVMSMGVNAGKVTGPVQIDTVRSVDPVTPMEISITRVVQTNEEEGKDGSRAVGEENGDSIYGTFGQKSMIPYGLYRMQGYFSPHAAEDTGVTQADLELFWNALEMMWGFDRASNRSSIDCHRIYVFSHDNPLGNAQSFKTTGCVSAKRKATVQEGMARSIDDYDIVVETSALPAGVTLTTLVS